MSSTFLPAVGTRLCLSDHLGTVRYVGPVDGTKGVWLGVEWDDPSRGKHGGTKDDRQYFSCLIPGAGSFIRPLPSLVYGRAFLRALVEKYIEIPHGNTEQEIVVLGSSNGAIQVEAVNLDKIRGKFARLERLREVSLDRENVSSADPPGQIRAKCANVRGVDLSFSLVPSWDVVALIAVELPSLQRLSLNNNRFQPLTNTSMGSQAFAGLTELQLNGTLMTWQAMIDIIVLMPRYTEEFNSLLEVINLDGNRLSNWADTVAGLRAFKRISRLILSANPVESIPAFAPSWQEPLQLKHLALSSTQISTWASIDALANWCPALETLSLSGTPLVEDPETGRTWRQIAVARLPALRALDGALVNARQRVDAELFYLSHVSQLEFPSEDARLAAHPQWTNLCQYFFVYFVMLRIHVLTHWLRPDSHDRIVVHGAPDAPSTKRTKTDKLSGRLIEIKASASPTSPPPQSPSALPRPIIVRILPTAPLRHLRLKLLKTFKAPRGASVGVWVRMSDGTLAPIGDANGTDDSREVDWWLEEGSEVVVHILE